MIKNKELLELIEQKKKQESCDNCKWCNLKAFYNGKWYCKNPKIGVFNLPVDIKECFDRR